MTWLWIAAGGALGSLARHGVFLVSARGPGVAFPLGTLCVNALGSLAFGMLAGWLQNEGSARLELRAFALAGFLGAFTTFSTYAWQSVELLQARAFLLLAANLLANNALALAGAWLGWRWMVRGAG